MLSEGFDPEGERWGGIEIIMKEEDSEDQPAEDVQNGGRICSDGTGHGRKKEGEERAEKREASAYVKVRTPKIVKMLPDDYAQ